MYNLKRKTVKVKKKHKLRIKKASFVQHVESDEINADGGGSKKRGERCSPTLQMCLMADH